MADAEKKVEKELRQITECPICMTAFNDPRMLPCIHTFCFNCLTRTGETAQKNPGDKMPCPLCRKEFIIPADGMNGVQKNFFMENLLEFNVTLQSSHSIVSIESGAVEEIRRITDVKHCIKHTQKTLELYCVDCKKIVCISCFVESHKSHDCKDVAKVDEELRPMIEKYAWKTSNYAEEMFCLKQIAEKRKSGFLKTIVENETAIIKRSQELKNMIDKHTKSLLDELSQIKSYHLKEMENKMEEIDKSFTIFRSFESYCTELRSKGSPSDICSSVDEITARAAELERDHEEFIGRPHQLIKVSFKTTDLTDILQMNNNNAVGQIKENTVQFENSAIVVGLYPTVNNDIVKINLHRPNEISIQGRIPTQMTFEAVAAVYCNTMYVIGIGAKRDEIWKYNLVSGWKKGASLVQGRLRHSAAFMDEVLYTCGGYVDYNNSVLDSVETYNTVTDKCTTVGKLVHCVQSSGNCVPVQVKRSLYIFGGSDKSNNAHSHVQVYDTKENTCTLLSKPMPRSYKFMGAALWNKCAVLLGRETCFIFNFETETWEERQQFKTDVIHFGLIHENGRIFVIGGGICETDKNGEKKWKCRDDVRSVPLQNILDDKPIEWKIHGTLPMSSLVRACANMRILV